MLLVAKSSSTDQEQCEARSKSEGAKAYQDPLSSPAKLYPLQISILAPLIGWLRSTFHPPTPPSAALSPSFRAAYPVSENNRISFGCQRELDYTASLPPVPVNRLPTPASKKLTLSTVEYSLEKVGGKLL